MEAWRSIKNSLSHKSSFPHMHRVLQWHRNPVGGTTFGYRDPPQEPGIGGGWFTNNDHRRLPWFKLCRVNVGECCPLYSGTVDQLFTVVFAHFFEGAWSMLNQSTCFFVDMEKDYDHVPQQFVVGGISVLTSCSLVLSGQSDSFVHILGI